MESEQDRASRYERQFGETGVSTAQAAERQERLDIKNRDYGSRTRVWLMPELPWHRKESTNAQD